MLRSYVMSGWMVNATLIVHQLSGYYGRHIDAISVPKDVIPNEWINIHKILFINLPSEQHLPSIRMTLMFITRRSCVPFGFIVWLSHNTYHQKGKFNVNPALVPIYKFQTIDEFDEYRIRTQLPHFLTCRIEWI